MFVFAGGVLSPNDIENIQPQISEIKSFWFFALDKMTEKVLPKMLRRLEIALQASVNNNTKYYETVYSQ